MSSVLIDGRVSALTEAVAGLQQRVERLEQQRRQPAGLGEAIKWPL
jgi:hypothetical protein